MVEIENKTEKISIKQTIETQINPIDYHSLKKFILNLGEKKTNVYKIKLQIERMIIFPTAFPSSTHFG